MGIAVLSGLMLFIGYWLYFAGWMTAYYSDPALIRLWQIRFYWLLTGLLFSAVLNLCLVVKVIRSHFGRK